MSEWTQEVTSLVNLVWVAFIALLASFFVREHTAPMADAGVARAANARVQRNEAGIAAVEVLVLVLVFMLILVILVRFF